MRTDRTLLVAGLIGLLLLAAPSSATAQTQLAPHPSTRFWIHGEATTHNFTCEVDEVKGSAQLPAPLDTIRPVSHTPEQDKTAAEVNVRIPIRAFECGNSRMTRDLQETLEMEQHPEIRFSLSDATLESSGDSSKAWSKIEVLGQLTISGTERLVRINTGARPLGNERYQVRGCLPVKMTYFGIEPPTKAFGLIRVKNEIRVQFDLIAETTSARTFPSTSVSPRTNPPPCDE